MKKKILFLLLFVIFLGSPVFSEDIEINSEVLTVNPDQEFFIIKAGKNQGIEEGDGFIVHRDGDKIADAYVIGVNPEVSAAEILKLQEGKEIMEGDSVLLVKSTALRKTPLVKETPSPIERTVTANKLQRKSKFKAPKEKASGYYNAAKSGESLFADIGNITIKSRPQTIFTYIHLFLKENGYYITYSNRFNGVLLAQKPFELPTMKQELWSDLTASIDHKVTVSFELKDEGSYSTLKVTASKEHLKKDNHIKKPLDTNSKYYKELTGIIENIKQHSEN